MLYFSVQDSTGFTKLPLIHCYSDRYENFSTESAAKTACSVDSNCKGVYDSGCDNKGPFYLCPLSATYAPSTSSCILEKKTQGNSNCSNIY